MKFVEVDPDEIDNTVATHRGRVSYPLLKQFLESGLFIAKLDRTGMQQSYQSLYSSVSGYIRRHNLPIKMFSRAGDVYFMRIDIDKHGNKIPGWETAQLQQHIDDVADLTPEEVSKRFGGE